MKNFLRAVLVLTVFNFGPLQAQQKFIEVMVKDTIRLNPISYEFEVSSSMKFRFNFENPDGEKEYSSKLRASEEKIATQLKNWNYDFTPTQNPNAHYDLEITDKKGFMVKLNNESDKEKFLKHMKEIGANFHMADVEYENKKPKDMEMYARLLKKAQEKAELIANLGELKLGEVLEISESKSELSLISSFVENYTYSRTSGTTSTSFTFNKGVYEKSILVKYAVE